MKYTQEVPEPIHRICWERKCLYSGRLDRLVLEVPSFRSWEEWEVFSDKMEKEGWYIKDITEVPE